jgi:hypothetical protein
MLKIGRRRIGLDWNGMGWFDLGGESRCCSCSSFVGKETEEREEGSDRGGALLQAST